jgi:beta-galactosidase
VALRLTPDRSTLAGDGRDATPIRVEAVDAKGRPVPTAQTPIQFAIEGGRIIGLGNGDANSHEPEKGDRRSLYNGLAQVIVQTAGATGPLVVTARAEGLKPAEARIAVRPV